MRLWSQAKGTSTSLILGRVDKWDSDPLGECTDTTLTLGRVLRNETLILSRTHRFYTVSRHGAEKSDLGCKQNAQILFWSEPQVHSMSK